MSPLRRHLRHLTLLVLLPVTEVWCQLTQHSAAGMYRDGKLLSVTPLETLHEGPLMRSRAQCLARCGRLTDCVSFNYGQLSAAGRGCQLLGAALCSPGSPALSTAAAAAYFDVYRETALGTTEISRPELRSACHSSGRCAVPLCAPLVGTSCGSSAYCAESLPNSECGSSATCVCSVYYHANDQNTCTLGAGLGQACADDTHCTAKTSNSYCGSSGTCECTSGYFNSANTECQPVKTLGDSCPSNEACGDSARKECAGGTCACKSGYSPSGNTCYPPVGLGASCSVSGQCTGASPHATCSGGVCSCGGSTYNYANSECRSPVAFNGACTYNEDCQATDASFGCYDGSCNNHACSAYSHAHGGVTYEYRIAGTGSCSQGRPELRKAGGLWGQICDDGWDNTDATVFCRSVGYSSGTQHQSSQFYNTAWTPRFHMDDTACSGGEAALASCGNRGWGTHNCGSGEVAGVTCS